MNELTIDGVAGLAVAGKLHYIRRHFFAVLDVIAAVHMSFLVVLDVSLASMDSGCNPGRRNDVNTNSGNDVRDRKRE